MTLIEIFAILIIHWIADFILQSHKQAFNKSSSNFWLTMHILVYSMFIGICTVFAILIKEDESSWLPILIVPITFVAHWVTDYFTSRWVKYYRLKENYHNMFVVIGFDQLLHYAQLFICYKLLLQ